MKRHQHKILGILACVAALTFNCAMPKKPSPRTSLVHIVGESVPSARTQLYEWGRRSVKEGYELGGFGYSQNGIFHAYEIANKAREHPSWFKKLREGDTVQAYNIGSNLMNAALSLDACVSDSHHSHQDLANVIQSQLPTIPLLPTHLRKERSDNLERQCEAMFRSVYIMYTIEYDHVLEDILEQKLGRPPTSVEREIFEKEIVRIHTHANGTEASNQDLKLSHDKLHLLVSLDNSGKYRAYLLSEGVQHIIE